MHCLKKFYNIGFLCAATFLLTTHAFAQISKAEKKVWKKELRKLTPIGYKSLVEENQKLSSMVHLLTEEIDQQKFTDFKKGNEIELLEKELHMVSEKLKTREIQLGLTNEKGERWDSGVVFKVQIGAINLRHFNEALERGHHLEIESNDGLIRYVVGNFRDYEQANVLKKQMRIAGVKNAWIVPYKDGQRVLLKEVLEEVIDP